MGNTSSAGSVVVVGSTNIDLIMQVARLPAPGETVGDARFSQAFGGKGANQALAAARSGADVTFVSMVGDDDYGRSARSNLSAGHIDVSLMSPCSEPTGTALIFVDRDGENCIGVAPGANALCDPAHLERAGTAIASAAVVLLQLEIPLATVRAALRIKTDARVLLNAAPMQDLTPEDLKGLDTLIVNQTELAQILVQCGDAQSPDSSPDNATACRKLHGLGVANVVVTLGTKGVFLSAQGNQASWPGFEVDAVDTTGAGDTFCGALAARLSDGETFDAAIHYAQAAAALACTELGAQGAIPSRARVRAFLDGG